MSEYNIQMNKYNALNAEYDQLYPQPMKHASTHAKDGSDPILPSSIGAAELGEDGKVLASQVDAYSKEESISASTRTALGLATNATPDAALAKIAQQLSDIGGFSITQLWENASPTSSFAEQTISLNLNDFAMYIVVWRYDIYKDRNFSYILPIGLGSELNIFADNSTNDCYTRMLTYNDDGSLSFGKAHQKSTTNYSNDNVIPVYIYGIKGGKMA